MSFTPGDYSIIRDGCRRSAFTIAPIVTDLLHPASVVDVGCGEGWWLAAFAAGGSQVLGVDGHPGTDLAVARSCYRQADLSRDSDLELGRHELAVCLEVAEHLPPQRSDWLIDTLTAAADAVLFSAAIPGQGGSGHINEQWPSYWADKFGARGFLVTGALRWQIWDHAPDQIENWYAQNLLLCLKDPPAKALHLFRGHQARPLAVVHPVLWNSRQ